jgi:hypothetical protein
VPMIFQLHREGDRARVGLGRAAPPIR